MYQISGIPKQTPPLITVYGEGSLSISPDQATVTLGVIIEGEQLQEVQQESAMIIARVINSLLQLGISSENIQTVVYRIDVQYDYKDGQQIFRGYQVNHQLQIIVDNIELTGQIVDTAVLNGANSVTNIEFKVAHPTLYYHKALTLAMKDAHGKATVLANELNVRLNPVPQKVDELTSAPIVPFSGPLLAKAETTPIQPGEITITANIQIKYSFY